MGAAYYILRSSFKVNVQSVVFFFLFTKISNIFWGV